MTGERQRRKKKMRGREKERRHESKTINGFIRDVGCALHISSICTLDIVDNGAREKIELREL